MTALYSILGALSASSISILLAALVSMGRLSRLLDLMVSFSVGMLLGTALLHLLPESLHLGIVEAHSLTATLLGGLLAFFLMERFSLLRHDHHHEHDGHGHDHGHDRQAAGPAGLNLLVGSSVHAFADGLLIAAAFQADTTLGLITVVAIAAHEIPQQVGNFFVLLNSGFSKLRALSYNLVAGLGAVVGAVLGLIMLAELSLLLPYLLVLAASSFLYIALSDLIPMLHAKSREEGGRHWRQLLLVGLGVGTAYGAATLLHGH